MFTSHNTHTGALRGRFSTSMRGAAIALACALGALLLGACSKRSAQQASPEAAATQPTTFNAQMMEGADQAAIRSYLQSVHEIKPKKFEVQWSPDTVPVSRDEALRSLRSVSRDGNSYTFATSEGVVQKLQPGRIMWLWGMTIARIDRVGTIDDTTIVHTVPVPLSEAMPTADIEFESPLDFSSAISRPAPKPSLPPSSWKSVAVPARSPFRPVLYQSTDGSTEGSPPPADGAGSDQQTAEEDLVVGTQDGFTGEIAGWEFSIGYRTNGSKLRFELQGRKMEEGSAQGASNEMLRDERHEFYEYVEEQRHAEHEAAEAQERELKATLALSQLVQEQQGRSTTVPANASAADRAGQEFLRQKDEEDELNEAKKQYENAEKRAKLAQEKAKSLAMMKGALKQVFYIVYDNLDIRFRTRVDLGVGSIEAVIKTSHGGFDGTSIDFKQLQGKLDMEAVARMGEQGSGGVNLPIAHVPVIFNIPIIVGGLPFVVQVGGDFLVKVGLSGHHATHHIHTQFGFDGAGGGWTATANSKTDTNFSLSGGEPEVEENTASAPGASGSVWAVQIPRLGFGLGVFGVSAVGFIDHVVVITVTNAPGVAALNPPCKRTTIDRVAHVGADMTTIMPIPIIETLTHFLAWKKEVWHSKQWKLVDPDIPMCRIGN